MTAYRTVDVDGVEVFYREAGDPGAPTMLLLHGFPTSSTQYKELIDRLSDRFHLVAPRRWSPGAPMTSSSSPTALAPTWPTCQTHNSI